MNFLDHAVTTWLNGFARRSWVFDEALGFLSHNHLLKGGILAALVWWAWFRGAGADEERTRRSVIVTVLGAAAAMVVARLLALWLPFRLRPIHDGRLAFVPPHGMDQTYLDGWTSFPSDHAVLFFAIAAGLLFVSRRAGAIALAYTTLFVAFPRVYLGLHYLTDVLAGALIGAAITVTGNLALRDSRAIGTVAALSRRRPALFYPAFFLLTYQFADLFESGRDVGKAVVELVRSVIA